jgi:diguanylate cyclase (GGDEF)-like protein
LLEELQSPTRRRLLPRFADVPLIVKIGVAPCFALLMLLLLAGAALWTQQRQLALLGDVVRCDDARSRLEMDAKTISAANGALYEILAKQAAGGSAAASQASLRKVLAQVDAARADLRGLTPYLPPGAQGQFAGALRDLDNYRGAIQMLGSMLGVDFATVADFIQPYEANYTGISTPLEQLSQSLNRQSAAMAQSSRHEAAMLADAVIALAAGTLLIVGIVVGAVIFAVRRTVREISTATQRLAAGRHDFDLGPLHRRDEFGAIVKSLEVFEENQRRIAALRAEQKVMETRQREVRALAERDELTGLLNRRAMTPLVEHEIAACLSAPEHRPACLAMLDLDHFKAVNDDFGHPAGDEVLCIIAKACAAMLRNGDVLARWGGEEFLLMLPNTTLETAGQCLERLRENLARTAFDSVGPGLQITVSAGVAQILPRDTPQAAIARADQALYRAKNTGRDRVVLAPLAS